jgi:dTDP-4-dehydrorhamnose 3,5-epimerase
MKLIETPINGCYILDFFTAEDQRGNFTKTFHAPTLREAGIEDRFEESFYSSNHKGVIRGMHFQNPPSDHEKIVFCNAGVLIDVVVDLRKSSATYGKTFHLELSGRNHRGLYIPKGLAHGFETFEDHTLMTYLTSTAYDPHADAGIRYDSVDHQWKAPNPILSDRDKAFQTLDNFESPFE